jgi:hypothetical protein
MRKYRVSLPHLWSVIGAVWSDTEFPSDSFEFWHKIWSSSCRNRNSVMEPEERVKWEALPDEFTVWRGVNQEGRVSGFSWTIDSTVAVWFARRFAFSHPRHFGAGPSPEEVRRRLFW